MIACRPASVIFMRMTSTGRPPATIRSGVAIREAGNAQIHPQGHWKAVREHQRLCVAAVRGRDGGRAWARGASRGEFYSSGAPQNCGAVDRRHQPLLPAANIWLSHTARRVYYRCLRGAGAFAAGRDRALEARNEKRVHALEPRARPCPLLLIPASGEPMRG